MIRQTGSLRLGKTLLASILSLLLIGGTEITLARTGVAWADSSAPAASTTAPAPAAAAPAATPAAPSDLVIPSMNIHMKGFIDVYGQYNPTSAETTDFRAYDYGANSFNINMAQLKLWRPDDDGVGFVLRADFGPGAYASAQNFSPGYYGALGGGHAFANNSTTTLQAPNAAGMPYSSFWMEEAYINFLVPHTNKELEVYGGQFQTLANFEVIQPYGNWMISDGYTFFLGPYTHTGARLHYAPNSTTNLYLGVNNGWNSNFQSNEGSFFQDIELGLVANPISWLNINFSGYLGPQVRNMYFDPIFMNNTNLSSAQYTNGNANTPTWRNYGAFVVEVGPFDHLTLVTDDSYGGQSEGVVSATTGTPTGYAVWYSSENFVRYDINDTMDLVARYEVYYDPNGFMTGIQGTAINDESVDFQWNFYPNLISRIEYRHDNASTALFNNSLYSLSNHGSPLTSMDTVDLELIYTF